MRAKMKYICKKFINHQIKKCLLFCCRYNANFKLDQSVSTIHDSPPYFWDQWGWPPSETSLVSHAHDHWWTLDFANAFVSPGVNSQGELVPSHDASCRWLGDNTKHAYVSFQTNPNIIWNGKWRSSTHRNTTLKVSKTMRVLHCRMEHFLHCVNCVDVHGHLNGHIASWHCWPASTTLVAAMDKLNLKPLWKAKWWHFTRSCHPL
jgi:hypothetical protein